MVRLIERYLTEDIDAVRKQYPDIDDDLFYTILRLDPTYREGSNSVGKYGKWLLTSYKKDATTKSYVLERPEIAQKILRIYDQYKNDRTKEIEKDISRFSGLDDMAVAVDNVREAELSKKQLQRQAKKDKPYDMVFEGVDFAIFVPKNHEGDMVLASFGGSSKALWCTAADSDNGKWRYDSYLQEGGKYYVLINKKNYEDKYQFHFESEQFMDRSNAPIDLEEFLDANIEVKEFFEDEGYDVEKYFSGHVPEEDEEQVDMIEEELDLYGGDWIEWIEGRTIFGAIDRIDGMDDIAEGEASYFYSEGVEEQFDMLQNVGLMTEYDSFEDFQEENPDIEDLSDHEEEYKEKYKDMYGSVSTWVSDFYGQWNELSYRTKRNILDLFDLRTRDIAEYIVYEQGEGYVWCEDIVRERRENEF